MAACRISPIPTRRLNRSVSAKNGHTRSIGEARATERVTTIARIAPTVSRATMARVTTPSEPPPSSSDFGKPLPLQLELPPPAAAVPQTVGARPRRDRRRWLAPASIAIASLAFAVFALVAWVLPWYLRRECIEAAASLGIV